MDVATGVVGIVLLFVLIAFGANVMVALGLVGVVGLTWLVGLQAATSVLSTVFFETTHSFHFSVIPLFLLMGFFALRAGLGADVYEAAHRWLGGIRGGLAISTTVAAAGFGAASSASLKLFNSSLIRCLNSDFFILFLFSLIIVIPGWATLARELELNYSVHKSLFNEFSTLLVVLLPLSGCLVFLLINHQKSLKNPKKIEKSRIIGVFDQKTGNF